jgi:hypothetical protein
MVFEDGLKFMYRPVILTKRYNYAAVSERCEFSVFMGGDRPRNHVPARYVTVINRVTGFIQYFRLDAKGCLVLQNGIPVLCKTESYRPDSSPVEAQNIQDAGAAIDPPAARVEEERLGHRREHGQYALDGRLGLDLPHWISDWDIYVTGYGDTENVFYEGYFRFDPSGSPFS